ncbi:MAG: hypothetical protein HZC26_02225 [Candidatus Magasanikbacteria bacterium]|nr:hypothetical protein [Candidatus Magasanikbacteria bacterium]
MFFYLTLVLLFGPLTSVSALDFGSGAVKKAAGDAGYDPNTSEITFAETTGSIIAMILSFTGVIFLVLMIYAGWLWMTARGEEEPVEKAQKIIISSIIGLIILVGAYSITTFVVPRLTDVTGKDEGEKTICCRICSKADFKANALDKTNTLDDCSYTETSQELCVNECVSGQLGPEGNKCDIKELLGTSKLIVCSAANWSK